MPDGEAGLRAVAQLEQNWKALHDNPAPRPFRYALRAKDLPKCPPENHFDVIIAGGGLGLVAGVALAARGLRVMVFDRDRVGAAHREWNISERELEFLGKAVLFTERGACRHRRHSL